MPGRPTSEKPSQRATDVGTACRPRLPIVEELRPTPRVMDALRAFSNCRHAILLESARTHPTLGRYSFLVADPCDSQHDVVAGCDPFDSLRSVLRDCEVDTIPDLPPFQGGAAGLLSYELGRAWESVPPPTADEFAFPPLAVGVFDWVICWDHLQDRCWVICHGLCEPDSVVDWKAGAGVRPRPDRAHRRLRWVLDRLRRPFDQTQPIVSEGARCQVVEQFPVADIRGLTSNFRREEYLQSVQQVVDLIHDGEIFQANLSQRLLFPQQIRSLDLYARLREVNPAPFGGFCQWDDWAVVSASPERFLNVRGRDVETRPIKGTRNRKSVPEADLFTKDELRQSSKDQAENVMIVDLMRNDLSRVCEPGSIRVPQLCGVETFQTVQHLVSEVRGRLREDADVWDLFAATFPGGSITGAPKIRAMEVIAQIERNARGPYCGSLFYVGFDGAMDSSILIRTFAVRHGWIQCSVGGGIVADSDPRLEYEETWHKARGMVDALIGDEPS